MRTRSIFTLFVFACFACVNAQWTSVSSNTQAINDIHFADRENGFICSNSGVVAKTTDGGLNWTEFNTGFSMSFLSVFGINKDTVYTARKPLYKTVNSCQSWTDFGGLGTSSASIFDICFLSPKTGFIIKAGGIYKTTDYGANWRQVANNVYSGDKFVFTSKTTGYVVGGGTGNCYSPPCPPLNYGSILKTTDGGENWQKINFYNDTVNIINASFVNDEIGFCIASNNIIYKTLDGGASWSDIPVSTPGLITDGLFINDSTGYIVTYEGEIYRTDNTGSDWVLEASYTTHLQMLTFTGNAIFAIGESGKLYRRILDEKYHKTSSVFTIQPEVEPVLTQTHVPVLTNSYKLYNLSLINTQGQVVLSKKGTIDEASALNLQDLPNGLYILKMENANELITKKVVIKNR